MEASQNPKGVVRCVGKPGEQVKVYLEEKSDLFLKENMTDRVGHFQMYYLLGREYRLGRQTIYLIRGILEGEAGTARSIQFTEDHIRNIQRRQQRQFPKFKILGWALNQPGYGCEGAWRFAKENEAFFAQSPILLLSDGLEGSTIFYQWDDGSYQELGGYYVYSDQNPADFRSAPVVQQQEAVKVVAEQPEKQEVMPWDLPQEAKKKSVWEQLERLPVRERKSAESKENLAKVGKQEVGPLRVLTSLSAVMLTITLVLGMLTFNSVSTLDGIQHRLETMDQQIEQIHSSMLGALDPAAVPTQALTNTEEPTDEEGEGAQ